MGFAVSWVKQLLSRSKNDSVSPVQTLDPYLESMLIALYSRSKSEPPDRSLGNSRSLSNSILDSGLSSRWNQVLP